MMMISQVKHHSGVKPTSNTKQAKKPVPTKTNKPSTKPTSGGDTVQLGTANKSLFTGSIVGASASSTGNIYKHAILDGDKQKSGIFANPAEEETVDLTGEGVSTTVYIGAPGDAVAKGSNFTTTVKINSDDGISLTKSIRYKNPKNPKEGVEEVSTTTVSGITGNGSNASVVISSKNNNTGAISNVKLVGSKADLEKAIANLKGGKTEATTTATETASLSDLSPSSKAYQAKAKEVFLNSLAKNAPQLLAKSVAEVEKEFTVVKKDDGTFTVTPKETKEPTTTPTDTNKTPKNPFIEDNSNLA